MNKANTLAWGGEGHTGKGGLVAVDMEGSAER